VVVGVNVQRQVKNPGEFFHLGEASFKLFSAVQVAVRVIQLHFCATLHQPLQAAGGAGRTADVEQHRPASKIFRFTFDVHGGNLAPILTHFNRRRQFSSPAKRDRAKKKSIFFCRPSCKSDIL